MIRVRKMRHDSRVAVLKERHDGRVAVLKDETRWQSGCLEG
jgi:hypothetical protein